MSCGKMAVSELLAYNYYYKVKLLLERITVLGFLL